MGHTLIKQINDDICMLGGFFGVGETNKPNGRSIKISKIPIALDLIGCINSNS